MSRVVSFREPSNLLDGQNRFVQLVSAFWFVLVPVLGLAADTGKDEARVTVTVSDFDGQPIGGALLKMVGEDVALHFEGTTDGQGQYIVVVPQGTHFDLTCVYNGVPFKFGSKEIPKAGGPLNYALRLRIQLQQAPSERSGSVSGPPPASDPTMARTVVTVINSDDQPEPDALVMLDGVDVDAHFKATTDSNGEYRLQLPRGKTFHIKCDKYGANFDLGRQTVPDVDSYHLSLKLILKHAAFAQAGATAGDDGSKALVTVSVVDPQGNPESGAQVELKAVASSDAWTGTTDSLGRFVFLVPRNTEYAMTVEKYGTSYEGGKHKIPDVEKMEINLQISPLKKYVETYRLENVYFDTAKATLRPESYASLDELFRAMEAHASMVIELAGHTDSRGDDTYNLNLSRARANSVRDYLIQKGIGSHRLTAKGYGELEPVASNDAEEGRQLNRRTEVRIISR